MHAVTLHKISDYIINELSKMHEMAEMLTQI